MSPDAPRAGWVVRAAAAAAVAVLTPTPCSAALVPLFKWSAKVSGGYHGNVFYSTGQEKTSSYGATVRILLSETLKGPTNSYGLSYRTTWQAYSDQQAQDLKSLSHTFTASMNQNWSRLTRFQASLRVKATPEQNPYDEIDDPTDFNSLVRPRARVTTYSPSLGWRITTHHGNELRFNFGYYTSDYGDPVQPPPRRGQPPPPPQPFVDEESIKLSGSYNWEVGIGRRFDVTATYGHQIYDGTQVVYAPVDRDLDGTIDDYNTVSETSVSQTSDSASATVGYSWDISELTRGTVGVGAIGSTDNNYEDTNYSWAISAAIGKEITPTIATRFGLSRDISSFTGVGTSALGTRGFADFDYQLSPTIDLKTKFSYSDSESLVGTQTSVTYFKAVIVFLHRLGNWGGYNLSYAYNDQESSGNLVGAETGRTRYDLISMGLNFDPAKFANDGRGGGQSR